MEITHLSGVFLSHLLQHQLFVTLRRIFEVAMRLVVLKSLILGIVLDLEVLHLDKVLGSRLFVLVHLPTLQLGIHLIVLLRLNQLILLL